MSADNMRDALALLQKIVDVQSSHYGDGIATHLAMIDLAKEARALLAAQPASDARNNELLELLEQLKPNYGDVGSRDIDVTSQRNRIDAAIAALKDQS